MPLQLWKPVAQPQAWLVQVVPSCLATQSASVQQLPVTQVPPQRTWLAWQIQIQLLSSVPPEQATQAPLLGQTCSPAAAQPQTWFVQVVPSRLATQSASEQQLPVTQV